MRKLIGALMVCLVCAPAAHAAFPGQNGKLAYDSDRDGDFEIYSVNADGTSDTQLTVNTATDMNPAWSPDGTKIAFSSDLGGTTADVWVMDADGSNPFRLTNLPSREVSPAWSPDGSQLVFSRLLFDHWDLWKVDADGTDPVKLLEGASAVEPSWSPNGAAIALGYHASSVYPDITTLSPAGSIIWSHTDACYDYGPDWAPNGSRLVYEGENRLLMIDADGSNPSDPNCFSPGGVAHVGESPVWSPDGTKIAYLRRGPQWTIHLTDTDFATDPEGVNDQEVIETGSVSVPRGLDWQPLPVNGYPRPKGATPLQVYLVPAYEQCLSPTRTHGPPLAFPSCHPPAQESGALTVGTADANGKPAKSVSVVRFDTLPGNPATPADEADVQVSAAITDVYEQGTLADYAGDVQGTVGLRITDKLNTPHPGGPGAGTVSDTSLEFAVPCAPTPDPTVGATCALSTTVDALAPGAVAEGRRSIWALGQVEVADADGAPFLRQGIFIP